MIVLGIALPPHASAQSCHVGDLRPETSIYRAHVELLASFASYRNDSQAGEYQGYFASAGYNHPWFSAQAAVGYYRIVREGLSDYGVSDVALDVRGALARFGETMRLGLELAATLPTGDPDLGLGMGHVMLMPGAFFELRMSPVRLLLQLAYGRALGEASEHVHGSQPRPIVNPMNRSEVEHVATLSYQFHPALFAVGRLFGAVPAGDDHGAAREALGLGLGATLARYQLLSELQLPLVGQPFQARLQLSAAVAF